MLVFKSKWCIWWLVLIPIQKDGNACLPIYALRLQILCYLCFPAITILQQLLFIIQQFLMGFCGELKIGTLHNSINRANFLAETTIDALCHVSVIPSSSATAIFPFFCFNGKGLSRAHSGKVALRPSEDTAAWANQSCS